jgi:uncharacterized protein (DUF488 family)
MGDAWVVKALRLSEELEVDEKGTKVRRRTEIQEPKGQFERSVYAVRCISHFILNITFDVYLQLRRKGFQTKTQLFKESWRNSSTTMGGLMPCV